MPENQRSEGSFYELPPVWLGCISLPLLVLLIARFEDAPRLAVGLFFVGCVSLVAYAFRPGASGATQQTWCERMVKLGTALSLAWVVFSACFMAVTRDFIGVVLAFLGLIPALCVTPYLTLLTRKPFAAVVFALLAVFCMKLLGCSVVVLIYGWHADARGYTTMPWTHPNLLVWLFWLNNGAFSLTCYFLGARRFCRRQIHAA